MLLHHLNWELSRKKTIISKNDIQLSKVVGQGIILLSSTKSRHVVGFASTLLFCINIITLMLISVTQESQGWCIVATLTMEVAEIR